MLKSIEKSSPKIVRDPNVAGRIKRIILDSPQLNYILGGGFAVGRIYNFYGPFSGGKSAISNYIAGQLQRKMPENQQVVVFADFERSFDATYASENGLDVTSVKDGGKLLFLRPDSIEDFIDTCQQLITTGEIACIVMDSESAAPTKVQMTNEAGKCVSPTTYIEYDDTFGTLASLFDKAGYKDYASLPIGEGVELKKEILVASYEDGKKTFKKVLKLAYKGTSDFGYKVTSVRGTFLGTAKHRVYDAENDEYVSLESLEKKEGFLGLDVTGETVPLKVIKVDQKFDVLDIEVEGTSSYFTGGILSHNSTFGGAAKALSEGLRKLNILCSNHDTSMIVISQERANMCVPKDAVVTWTSPDWFSEDGLPKDSRVEDLFRDQFGLDIKSMDVLKPVDVMSKKINLLGHDFLSGKPRQSPVTFVVKKPVAKVKTVRAGEFLLRASEDHLVYSNGYVRVMDLKPGDVVKTVRGDVTVDEVSDSTEEFVYDFTTGLGNYFANGVLSHNSPMAHLPATCVTPDTVVDVLLP